MDSTAVILVVADIRAVLDEDGHNVRGGDRLYQACRELWKTSQMPML